MTSQTEQRETPWQREQRIERELSAERRELLALRGPRRERVRMDGGGSVTLERRFAASGDEYVRVVEVAA